MSGGSLDPKFLITSIDLISRVERPGWMKRRMYGSSFSESVQESFFNLGRRNWRGRHRLIVCQAATEHLGEASAINVSIRSAYSRNRSQSFGAGGTQKDCRPSKLGSALLEIETHKSFSLFGKPPGQFKFQQVWWETFEQCNKWRLAASPNYVHYRPLHQFTAPGKTSYGTKSLIDLLNTEKFRYFPQDIFRFQAAMHLIVEICKHRGLLCWSRRTTMLGYVSRFFWRSTLISWQGILDSTSCARRAAFNVFSNHISPNSSEW